MRNRRRPEAMSAQSKGAKILFIDDDDDLVDALSLLLESSGYSVRRAADGDEGLRMAREETPDLVLLDFMMPVKSGFDTSQEMRQIESLRNVPIIALTSFGQNIGEIYGLSSEDAHRQIQGFLEKPVEPNVLLERIAQALGPR
jgi:DNA-binding response OmpR family regulator